MNILVIEDEATVVSLIQRSLAEEGMAVSVALDGPMGLQMARDHAFDIILLDIMLPGMNGIELCKILRKEKVTVPILMLTALGSTENVVTGLNSGADDYMVKPFKITELLARIRTLGRRQPQATRADNTLQVGQLVLNLTSKSVTRDGEPVSLTATEFRLLEFFMRNVNRVLTRMEILENVWDLNFNLSTNVVDVYVNYLRKKIDRKYKNKTIHTLVGMGYIMKPGEL